MRDAQGFVRGPVRERGVRRHGVVARPLQICAEAQFVGKDGVAGFFEVREDAHVAHGRRVRRGLRFVAAELGDVVGVVDEELVGKEVGRDERL